MINRPNLFSIACGRGVPVNINVEAASARGIPVLYAPGRNAQAVAEFTLAGMISLMRRMPAALRHIRRGDWLVSREDTFEKPSGPELGGRTLGLIGFGQVGQLVARLAIAFGARVLAMIPWLATEKSLYSEFSRFRSRVCWRSARLSPFMPACPKAQPRYWVRNNSLPWREDRI